MKMMSWGCTVGSYIVLNFSGLLKEFTALFTAILALKSSTNEQ